MTPEVRDIITTFAAEGRTPQETAQALSLYREDVYNSIKSEAGENARDAWVATDILDRDIQEGLDALRVSAVTSFVDEKNLTQFDQDEFWGRIMMDLPWDDSIGISQDDFMAINNDPAFRLPTQPTPVANVNAGENRLFSYQLRPRTNGTFDALVSSPNKPDMVLSLPDPSSEELSERLKSLEEQRKQQVKDILDVDIQAGEDYRDLTDEDMEAIAFQEGPDTLTPTDVAARRDAQRQLKITMAKLAAMQGPNAKEFARNELLIERMQQDDMIDYVGGRGAKDYGQELMVGLSMFALGTVQAAAMATGNQEEAEGLARLSRDIQSTGGAFGVEFNGGMLQRSARSAARSVGMMAPAAALGPAARVAGLGAGAAETAAISTLGPASFALSYNESIAEAEALEVEGRIEEAQTIRNRAGLRAAADTVFELGVERINPFFSQVGAAGWARRLPAQVFQEAIIEEPLTLVGQEVVSNRIVNRPSDFSQLPDVVLSAAMATTGMQVAAGAVETVARAATGRPVEVDPQAIRPSDAAAISTAAQVNPETLAATVAMTTNVTPQVPAQPAPQQAAQTTPAQPTPPAPEIVAGVEELTDAEALAIDAELGITPASAAIPPQQTQAQQPNADEQAVREVQGQGQVQAPQQGQVQGEGLLEEEVTPTPPSVQAGQAAVIEPQPPQPNVTENQVQETGVAPPVQEQPPVQQPEGQAQAGTPQREGEGQEVADLIAVRDNTATPEQVDRLQEQGLAERVDGQNVITEAGIQAMPEAERPRLSEEERRAEIEAEPITQSPIRVAPKPGGVGATVSTDTQRIVSDALMRRGFNPEAKRKGKKGSPITLKQTGFSGDSITVPPVYSMATSREVVMIDTNGNEVSVDLGSLRGAAGLSETQGVNTTLAGGSTILVPPSVVSVVVIDTNPKLGSLAGPDFASVWNRELLSLPDATPPSQAQPQPDATPAAQEAQPEAAALPAQPAEAEAAGDAGVTQRDPSKPEQMTPEEWVKSQRRAVPTVSVSKNDLQKAWSFILDMFSRAHGEYISARNTGDYRAKIRLSMAEILAQVESSALSAKERYDEFPDADNKSLLRSELKRLSAIKELLAESATQEVFIIRGGNLDTALMSATGVQDSSFIKKWKSDPRQTRELSTKGHKDAIELAFQDAEPKPVSAAAVDTYGIQLPEGYVRQGDLYIFQPASEQSGLGAGAATTPQGAIESPTAPQAGTSQPRATGETPVQAAPQAAQAANATAPGPIPGSAPTEGPSNAAAAQVGGAESPPLHPASITLRESLDRSLSEKGRQIFTPEVLAAIDRYYQTRDDSNLAGLSPFNQALVKNQLLQHDRKLSSQESIAAEEQRISAQERDDRRFERQSTDRQAMREREFGRFAENDPSLEQDIEALINSPQYVNEWIQEETEKAREEGVQAGDTVIAVDESGETVIGVVEETEALAEAPGIIEAEEQRFEKIRAMKPSQRSDADIAFANYYSKRKREGTQVAGEVSRKAFLSQHSATSQGRLRKSLDGEMNLDGIRGTVGYWIESLFNQGWRVVIDARANRQFTNGQDALGVSSLGASGMRYADFLSSWLEEPNKRTQTKTSRTRLRLADGRTVTVPTAGLVRQSPPSLSRKPGLAQALMESDGAALQLGISARDVEKGIAATKRQIPGATNIWYGTRQEFLDTFGNDPSVQDMVAQLEEGVMTEGFFVPQLQRGFILTDSVVVYQGDADRAALNGTTPAVEAVKRLIRHEVAGHGGWLTLTERQTQDFLKIARDVIPLSEMNQMIEDGYPFQDWQTNEEVFRQAAEEWFSQRLGRLDRLPETGPLARFVEWLKDVWRWLTGRKTEPDLQAIKNLWRQIRMNQAAIATGRAWYSLPRDGARQQVRSAQDAEYLAAVERGDSGSDNLSQLLRGVPQSERQAVVDAWVKRNPAAAERLQRMADEAAKEASKKVYPYDQTESDISAVIHGAKVFHGTESKNRIDVPRINFGEDSWKQFGIHVGTRETALSREFIRAKELEYEGLGKQGEWKIMPLFLSGRFLKLNENRTGRWGVDDVLRTLIEDDKASKKLLGEELVKKYYDDALQISDLDSTFDFEDYDLDSEVYWVDASPGQKAEALMMLLEQNGFNGIEYQNKFEGGGVSYLVTDRSAIKSADAVTYDDAGNIIPLSQRFQSTSSDIRYSRVRSNAEIAAAIRQQATLPNDPQTASEGRVIREDIAALFDQRDRKGIMEAPYHQLMSRNDGLDRSAAILDTLMQPERDPSKPAEMTPQEIEAQGGDVELNLIAHEEAVRRALVLGDAVSTSALTRYGISLPEGYRKFGELSAPVSPALVRAAEFLSNPSLTEEAGIGMSTTTYEYLTARLQSEIANAVVSAKSSIERTALSQAMSRLTRLDYQVGSGTGQKLGARGLAKRHFGLTNGGVMALVENVNKEVQGRIDAAVPVEDLVSELNRTKAAIEQAAVDEGAAEIEADTEVEVAEADMLKQERIAEGIIEEIANRLGDPPVPTEQQKQRQESIRDLHFRNVRQGMTEEQFVAEAARFEVFEELAVRLWNVGNLEREARATIKAAIDGIRRQEIAEARASRLIYSVEERLRQGSKDLDSNQSGDTINRAFRDQVSKPVPMEDFQRRLSALGVGQDVAERLFRTAAREQADIARMNEFRRQRRAEAVQQRQIEIAQKRASQLIYGVEERLRQGSKDLEESPSRDTINKAFRDQVSKPVSFNQFQARLRNLRVNDRNIERLFRTAERERIDLGIQEMMRTRQSLLERDSPHLAAVIRRIKDRIAPGISWRDLMVVDAQDGQQRIREIYRRVRQHEALRGLTHSEAKQLTNALNRHFIRQKEKVLRRELQRVGGMGGPIDPRVADLFLKIQRRELTAAQVEQEIRSLVNDSKWKALRKELPTLLNDLAYGRVTVDQFADKLGRPRRAADKAMQAVIDSTPKLVQAMNLGSFNAQAFRDAVSEKFGLRVITSEQAREIQQMANEAMRLPEGLPRRKAMRAIIERVADFTKLSKTEIVTSYNISSILFGVGTQESTAANILTAFQRILLMSSWLGIERFGRGGPTIGLRAIKRFWQVVPGAVMDALRHLYNGDTSMFVTDEAAVSAYFAGSDRGSLRREKMEALFRQSKQHFREGNFWRGLAVFPSGIIVGVSRLMSAADYVSAAAALEGIIPIAMALNPEIYDSTRIPDSKDYQNYLLRAREFLTGGRPPRTMREKMEERVFARDLLQQSINSLSLRDEITEFSLTSSWQNDPTGIGGIIWHTVKNFHQRVMQAAERARDDRSIQDGDYNAAVKLADRAVRNFFYFLASNSLTAFGLAFIRFAGNKTNDLISYTPIVGLLRIPLEKQKKSRTRDTMIKAQNMLGTAIALYGYSVILDLFGDGEDEEERGWRIEGGHNNLTYEERNQLLTSGRQPYSIAFFDEETGNWTSYSYKEWPVSAALAAVGNLSDRKRYTPKLWDEQSALDIVVGLFVGTAQAALDQSALTNFSDMFNQNRGVQRDPTKTASEWFNKFSSNFAGGFVPRIIKDVDYALEPERRKAEPGIEMYLQHVPFYRREVGQPFMNTLMEQVKSGDVFTRRFFVESEDSAAVRSMAQLNARGLFVPAMNVDQRVARNGDLVRPLTESERGRLMTVYGQMLRSYLVREGPRLERMPFKEAQEKLSNDITRLKREAQERAVR